MEKINQRIEELAPMVPTHCLEDTLVTYYKVQSYYFNDKFMLQRHDYAAEISGRGGVARSIIGY